MARGGKRHYSDGAKAAALATLDAEGGNLLRAAKASGVPRATLQEWAAGRVSDEVPGIRHQKKADLAEKLEGVARECLGGITKEKIDRADAVDCVKTAAIAIDKMRLLREQPTDITQHNLSGLSDEDLQRDLQRLRRARVALAEGNGAPRGGA